MANPALPITAFIGAILVLFPLPSHWRARNYATISLIAWLFVIDIIYGINSAIWNDNIRIQLLVWCDISAFSLPASSSPFTDKGALIATKLIIGASVALPATAMCICKHLESVASGRIVRISHADKQRRMFFELALCFLLPAVIMALRAYTSAFVCLQ